MMKEITLTEEKLKNSIVLAVFNIMKKAPQGEGFVDFLFINATVAGMIEAELNKILFGDMENNQNNEDVKS